MSTKLTLLIKPAKRRFKESNNFELHRRSNPAVFFVPSCKNKPCKHLASSVAPFLAPKNQKTMFFSVWRSEKNRINMRFRVSKNVYKQIPVPAPYIKKAHNNGLFSYRGTIVAPIFSEFIVFIISLSVDSSKCVYVFRVCSMDACPSLFDTATIFTP